MALEICITVLTYRSAPWRFTLPGGNVAFLLVGPTGCLVGTEIWELNGIIISCAELSHTAVFAVNHTVSVNSLYQTADQNKSLLSSFSTSGPWGGIHTVTSIWQYRARERASGFCLPGLKNNIYGKIIEFNWKLCQWNQPQKEICIQKTEGKKPWDLLANYPWFSPTVRAITIALGCGRACHATEKCKTERKLIFIFPFLGPVCQCKLDCSLMTDGYNPWGAKNPNQKFMKVHMRVSTDNVLSVFWFGQLNSGAGWRVKELESSLEQFQVVELPSLIEMQIFSVSQNLVLKWALLV